MSGQGGIEEDKGEGVCVCVCVFVCVFVYVLVSVFLSVFICLCAKSHEERMPCCLVSNAMLRKTNIKYDFVWCDGGVNFSSSCCVWPGR